MSDKMMRIAGRGVDGTAKAIKTDSKGNLGVQLTGSVSESFDFSEKVVPTKNISVYNQVVIDVLGDNPFLYVQGRGVTGEWVSLPFMDAKRFLMSDAITRAGRYYVDLLGYNELRIIKVSSTSFYQGRATLLLEPLPAPLDTEIKYKRITPADGTVDGYFRAIEPLTDITMDVATRFMHMNTSGVFQKTDVRLAGQPIYGPFNRVKIRDGVALLVLL